MESEEMIHLILKNVRHQHQKLMNGITELTQRSDVSEYETLIRSVSNCCTILERIAEQLAQSSDSSSKDHSI